MSGLINAHDFTPTVVSVSGSLLMDTYYVVTAAGATTQTLPLATGSNKQIIIENTGTGTIALASSGSDTINGVTSVTLMPYDKAVIRDSAAGVWMLTMSLTTGTQTIAGVKTFSSAVNTNSAINGNINSRMNVLISSIPTNPLVWEVGPAGPGSNTFLGGVLLPNGKVFAIPYYYTGTNTIYNPTTNAWEVGPAGTGSNAFVGGVLLPNGKVFAIPSSYTGTNTIYNPAVVGWPYGQWMLHPMFNKF